MSEATKETRALHRCRGALVAGDISAWGPAVELCFEQSDGSLWAATGDGEYVSRVNYCPFCGKPTEGKPVAYEVCPE